MTTHVIAIIDASGSMKPFTSDTLNGYNGYLDDLAADANQVYRVTTVLFSSADFYKVHAQALAPSDPAARLDKKTYITKGFTALLDATGKAIGDFIESETTVEGDKVIFAILTDGHENDSRQFTNASVKAMMDAYTALGWEFIFMAQGFDGWAQASAMGVNTNSYVGTTENRGETISLGYSTLSKFSQGYSRGYAGAGGQSVHSVAEEVFDPADLRAAPDGDK